MKIRRSGARAHHGYSSIDLDECSISWDDDASVLRMRAQNVADFSTDSHHDYQVTINVQELNRMVDAVAEAAIVDGSGALLTGLSGSLRSMLRIAVASVGLGPVIAPDKAEEEGAS